MRFITHGGGIDVGGFTLFTNGHRAFTGYSSFVTNHYCTERTTGSGTVLVTKASERNSRFVTNRHAFRGLGVGLNADYHRGTGIGTCHTVGTESNGLIALGIGVVTNGCGLRFVIGLGTGANSNVACGCDETAITDGDAVFSRAVN